MKLTIEPSGEEIVFEPGETLQDIFAENGVFFPHPCGGRGKCGKCLVRYKCSPPDPTEQEQKVLTEKQVSEGFRFSCQSRPDKECVIELHGAGRSEFQFALSDHTVEPVEIDPEVRKTTVTLEIPTLERQGNYLDRLLEQMKLNKIFLPEVPYAVPADVLRRLPEAATKEEGLMTVTHSPRSIIEVEPGDRWENHLGVAIDVGTTTVAARLVHLHSGKTLTQTATLNRQSKIGVDVVSRIEHCYESSQGLKQLHVSIREDLDTLVRRLLSTTGHSPHEVAQVSIMGNTTMMHLLLGVDPRAIAHAPYTPTWTHMLHVPAREVGLNLASGCEAVIGPAAAAYVGADILAGVVACGMDKTEKLSLLVDIGTNGEIVLGNKDHLVAAATAAGPAFEGAQISCGCWAAPGAIEHVSLNETVKFRTIQNKPPIGICGSGLIDVVAELVRTGIVTNAGKMRGADELQDSADVHPNLAERIGKHNGGEAFRLADDSSVPVFLTAGDVRQFQLAKGAVQAGLDVLMKVLGVGPSDIERVYLAGAFGHRTKLSNLQRIGLLHDIDESKIRWAGNSSLAGAQLVLLSRSHRKRIENVHDRIDYVELSSRRDFMDVYAEAMMFSG